MVKYYYSTKYFIINIAGDIEMIEIVLINGKVMQNDPKLGFNSKSIEEIKASLEEFGEYFLSVGGTRYKILKKHVVEIRETK
jgi:hypothetical protein